MSNEIKVILSNANKIETKINWLSSNDYTSVEKAKLANVPSDTNAELNNKADKSSTYTKAEVDAKDSVLDNRIDSIITTPVDSVSAQEIIDARDGEASLGAKIQSIDGLIDNITSSANKTSHTQTESIKSLPTGSLDGKVSNFQANGLSLVNLVKNGDFSQGTTGWAESGGLSVVSSKILLQTANGSNSYPYIIQSLTPMIPNNLYFVFVLAKVTNAVCESLSVSYKYTIKAISNPVQNQQYELYGIVQATDSNQNLIIQHTYTDATTANGKVMEVDGNAGVFAINMTALGIESYTEAQMLDLVRGGYFDGLKGVENPTFESVGKNLFDKNASIIKTYVDTSTGLLVEESNVGWETSELIKIKPNNSYVLKGYYIIQTGVKVVFYDSNGGYISGDSTLGGLGSTSVTSPSNAHFLRVSYRNTDSQPVGDIQLEQGTVATAYEPYKSSQLSANVTLRSLPNGVKDRVFEQDGQIWLEKNVAEYTLQASDITNSNTIVFTNIDLYLTSGTFGLFELSATNLNSIVEGYKYLAGNADDSNSYYTWRTEGTSGILFRVPKGTYANLAAAQTALAGTKIHYQLATPQLINLSEQGKVDGELSSFSNGTSYLDSDTFHVQSVQFSVPSNTGAQITALLESANAQAKQIEAKANKVQEAFITPTMTGAWTPTDVGYYKDDFGEVHLKGYVTGGSGSSFTLATGYRPSVTIAFKQADTTTGNPKVTIGTDGTVTPSGACYLDGITFKAV